MAKHKPRTRRGDCFQVHADFVLNLGKEHAADMRVCHGLVFHPKHGYHSHAWIELRETCLDMSNGRGIAVPKERYYVLGKIKMVKRYTARLLLNKVLEHENYGPWHLDDVVTGRG